MAFKSVTQYNEEKYGGLFRLQNDQDTADVIFLYQSDHDVLVADVHYIKSADYNGYVHCNGRGCPACAKGIRVQNKLFIPIYNITAGEIQFWDRTMKFEPQLHADVFARYPNPSDYVFRITRNGGAGDVNTKYTIMAVGNNTYKSFDSILAENKIELPAYYETICKDVDAPTLSSWLSNSNTAVGYSGTMANYTPPTYTATPRAASPVISTAPTINAADLSVIGADLVDTDEEIDEDVNFD